MKEKVLGLVGAGFVGSAVQNHFSKFVNFETFDIIKEKRTISSIAELMERCETIFVAVPTPIVAETGGCYMSNIHSVYSKLNKYGKNHLVILKSSVPPQTTKMLNAEYRNVRTVFNPEFLREKSAKEDYSLQDKIILGGENEEDLSRAEEAYRIGFPKIPIYKTDPTSAEMVKFMVNIFLATKVSLSNEFFTICEKLGIEYEGVRKLATLDPRIGYSHTQVPGDGTASSIGGRGIAGACFPTNINILIDVAKKIGVQPKIMEAVQDRNNNIDRPEKDWLIEGKTIVYTKKGKE